MPLGFVILPFMFAALVVSTILTSMAAAVPNEIINLWPNGNPGGWHRTDEEKLGETSFKFVSNVSHPTLEFFRAPGNAKYSPVIMVCPGGGYSVEAIEHEGTEIVQMLNKAGFNAALLKYRLPLTTDVRYIPPLQDAQRALRLLRAWKKREGLPDGPVGIMGFSAGGHLSAVTSNATSDSYPAVDDNDHLSAKPDFSVLIYPAYLDANHQPELPPEVVVTGSTPPAFILTTADDDISNVSSLSYDLACVRHKVPVEFHMFPKGGHGYGLRSKEPGLRDWPNLLIAWLKQRA